jgi:hypothetical protein
MTKRSVGIKTSRPPFVGRLLLVAILLSATVVAVAATRANGLGASDRRVTSTEVQRSRRVAQKLASPTLAFGKPVESASSFVELKAQITSTASATKSQRSTKNRLSASPVGSRRVQRGHLPQLRSVQPSEMQLLVVGVDATGHVRFSSAIANPLLIRAETPGADGLLHGSVIERPSAEMLLRVPDDPAITEVRVYRPIPKAGGKTSFRLVGKFPSGSTP